MPARRRLLAPRTAGFAAALIAVVLPLAPLQALEPRRVEIVYEAAVGPLAGLRAEVKAQFDESGYDVESRTFKTGALRALTARYEGYNRAWGRLGSRGASASPSGGILSVTAGDERRTWRVRYGANGALEEAFDPSWHPSPSETIGEGQRRGSLDPLSAILSASMAGDRACERTVAAIDGKRRVDVLATKLGWDSVQRVGVPQARDEILVCEARVRRVAGAFARPADQDRRARPMKLWLARLDDSPFRYLAKLEMESSLGTVSGRLVHFAERPLTPAERTAMLR